MVPVWRIRDRTLSLDRPLVMGIVNVTPDSFSDGGQFDNANAAIEHVRQLIADGADILDIGGESTRPGATPVSEDEELRRVVPVIAGLANESTIISIDTSKAGVAREALAAGASIVNDVTGLIGDPEMAWVAQSAGVVVMHMLGTPQSMQIDPQYPDGVVATIDRYFESRLRELAKQDIAPEQVALDPGIGFGKTGAHNWELLSRLSEFRRFGRPICLGVSRKGLLGRLVDRPVAADRDGASLAVACFALAGCGPLILRVHNVRMTRDAVRVFERMRACSGQSPSSSSGSS
jgi:dihydropteroate synthase